MPSPDSFDRIVIGCGRAGEKAAAQAAYFGKRVAVIERTQAVGGSCINTGTVPSKTLRESATELIHIGMIVLDKGLPIDESIEQVFNYPTLSEMYKYAAYDGLGNLAGHKLREG